MTKTLAEIIAEKKQETSAKQARTDTSDCFVLNSEPAPVLVEATPPEAIPYEKRKLLLLCILVNISAHRSNLFAGDHSNLRLLAAWLSPFPSDFLPYTEPIPQFMKSYAMWSLSALIKVPPAKLWSVCQEAILETEKISIDKKREKI